MEGIDFDFLFYCKDEERLPISSLLELLVLYNNICHIPVYL